MFRNMRLDNKRRGFTLIELMIVVAIIGILASIAVPSFLKYMRKARTTEARQQLEKIYNAARVYYLEQHGAGGLAAVQPQFPNSQASTPAVTCCVGGLDRCIPDPALWETPTWKKLYFSMDDPHYYHYEFVRVGIGAGSAFTARAMGDLDCDTKFSTFEMSGHAPTVLGEGMTGSGAMSRINPLE